MSVLKYRISRLNVSRFSVVETENLDNLQLATSFQFKINIELHLLSCIGIYEYKKADKSIMALDLECYFNVEQEYFNSLIQDDILTINQDMLQYMATISVGAARGEIHARCEVAGSILRDMVLPPINLTQIITTPAIFKL